MEHDDVCYYYNNSSSSSTYYDTTTTVVVYQKLQKLSAIKQIPVLMHCKKQWHFLMPKMSPGYSPCVYKDTESGLRRMFSVDTSRNQCTFVHNCKRTKILTTPMGFLFLPAVPKDARAQDPTSIHFPSLPRTGFNVNSFYLASLFSPTE
eukprot:scaffold2154_cov283-Chaetoceros_neogracile.AAC.9